VTPPVNWVSHSESGEDSSDFEEVKPAVSVEMLPSVLPPNSNSSSIPIRINFNKDFKLKEEEDIFADIFKTTNGSKENEDEEVKAVAVISKNSDSGKTLSGESSSPDPEAEEVKVAATISLDYDSPKKMSTSESSSHEAEEGARVVKIANDSAESDLVTVTNTKSAVEEVEGSKVDEELEPEWGSDLEMTSDLEDALSQETRAPSSSSWMSAVPEVKAVPESTVPDDDEDDEPNHQPTRTLGMIPSQGQVQMITAGFLQAQVKLYTFTMHKP
jgi:hypothetical protein